MDDFYPNFQASRTKSPYRFERYRTYMENIVCGIEQTIILAQTRKLDTRPTFSTVSLYTSLLPADAASILTATNQNQGWDKTFWRDKKSCNNGTNRRASLSALLCSWGHESCVSSGRGDTGTTIEKRYTDKFVVVTSNSSSGTSLEIYTVTEE